ncbi:type II toxin-antitoxin system RatA family toxin [Aquimonas sp.]|jgi:ribosome-associated toxin RatA of RatAB toxin-antitoxin module|uniref:type II toxin-antitoxin system RatA family toxin n=1 Tax=Aquimonas sp. TaxID=1872588 RepID=UPI0037BEEB9C
MTPITRSALVRRPATLMFDLVNEVEDYPRRFAWCEGAHILERSEEAMLARLELKMGALRTAFTTRNRLERPGLIELQLVEGPFTRLSGRWVFTALAEDASKVALELNFETAGRIVGSALAIGFTSLADRMVDDFVREAQREPT